jgi:hypothetical protein
VIFDFPENPLNFNVKKNSMKNHQKAHKFPAKSVIIRDLDFRSKSQKKNFKSNFPLEKFLLSQIKNKS